MTAAEMVYTGKWGGGGATVHYCGVQDNGA
jgi:hypothetical protein